MGYKFNPFTGTLDLIGPNGGLGAVTSVSNSDGTLTISPTTGSVIASIALGHANTWTGGQTFTTSPPSAPGAGASSQTWGGSSHAAGDNGTAVGTSAGADGLNSTAIGKAASASNTRSIAIGKDAAANEVSSLSIGANSTTNYADSAAIGYFASSTAANQFVVGSSLSTINDIYFGNGVVNTSPSNLTLNATGGSGSNVAGADINIAGGRGTGTGVGGKVNFKTALHSSTGSSLNTLVDVGWFDESGAFTVSNAIPTINLSDTTASAKSLTITVNSNIADLRESAGGSGSLLSLDLANNRVGIGAAPSATFWTHVGTNANLAVGQNSTFVELYGINDAAAAYNTLLINASPLIINNNTARKVTIGGSSPSAKLDILSTTEQLRILYDTSNYYSTTVSSAGAVTFNAVGASAGFTFSGPITNTNAALTTPNIGVATATSVNKMAITAPATSSTISVADGKTFTASNTITLVGTDSVSMNVSNNKIDSIGFTAFNSPITTGKIKGYITVPFSGTITAWSLGVDAGTATIKVWKVATGTAVPTSANNINTSGVSISSGTYIRSTTLSDFTTTTVTANDIIAFNIQAVATATEMTFQLEITKT